MKSILRNVLLAVCVSVVVAGGTAYAADQPRTTFLGQTTLDSGACRAMKSELLAAIATQQGRAKVDAARLNAIRTFNLSDGSDCVLKAYARGQGSGVAEASYVQGYWQYMTFYIGPAAFGTIHVDVGMLITGSTATANWGPNCYFQWNTGLFDGGITWCGVWNNGAWYTEPGANYWVNIYPFTSQPRNHYMRYCVYGNGASCYRWGS